MLHINYFSEHRNSNNDVNINNTDVKGKDKGMSYLSFTWNMEVLKCFQIYLNIKYKSATNSAPRIDYYL